jgi:transposase InsO family protein
VAKAFESLLSEPLVVRTDRGKQFLGSALQKLLKDKSIEHRVCKDPVIKYSMVERFNRTIKTKLYKYFTYKSSYRYVDVLAKFVEAYNRSTHSATGISPINITASNILQVWQDGKPAKAGTDTWHTI